MSLFHIILSVKSKVFHPQASLTPNKQFTMLSLLLMPMLLQSWSFTG